MSIDRNTPQAAPIDRPYDLLARLYREIGISAVAAALQATSRKPQKQNQVRREIPAVLRNDEAA